MSTTTADVRRSVAQTYGPNAQKPDPDTATAIRRETYLLVLLAILGPDRLAFVLETDAGLNSDEAAAEVEKLTG